MHSICCRPHRWQGNWPLHLILRRLHPLLHDFVSTRSRIAFLFLFVSFFFFFKLTRLWRCICGVSLGDHHLYRPLRGYPRFLEQDTSAEYSSFQNVVILVWSDIRCSRWNGWKDEGWRRVWSREKMRGDSVPPASDSEYSVSYTEYTLYGVLRDIKGHDWENIQRINR